MKKRLILFVTVIIIISVAASSLISAVFSINHYLDSKSQVLNQYARVIGDVLYNDYTQNVQKPMEFYAVKFSEDTGYRITMIDSEGNVLADSMAADSNVVFDNHSNREEVRDALSTGAGESRRESATFGMTYLYSAIALTLPDDEVIVIRLAMQIDRWEIAKNQVIGSTLIASLIGIALAVILVFLYSRRLLIPVREMERELEITIEKNKKAENIRKDFVANVTHELKTPLTSISGFVETMLEEENIDEKTREKFLGIIFQEAGRLSRLIDDIFIISDIESGRESISDEDINVEKSINEVIDTLKPLAEEKNIAIVFNCEYEMYLGGSEDRFKQMFLNLIENAIKYSDSDSKVIVKAVKKVFEQKVILTIRDEGIGIKDEDLERLFERFYRVDKSRSMKTGGTGLGLAIVKHIANLFDAEVKVESEFGKGSLFTVTFSSNK